LRVPFVDLKRLHDELTDELSSAVNAVVEKAAFIRGPFVEEFENNFAQYCGLRNCTGVGNGTDALRIALKGLGIGPGDEVIVPANSFVATSEAVTASGAQVVFADVDPLTRTINPVEVKKRTTSKTRGIIPVHLYGHPADLPALRAIADEQGLKIVQDCAQAHGAFCGDQPIGAYGDVLCFSFFPGKNLGAFGDAGAVLTDDDEVAAHMKKFANHGRISKYDHEFEGINSRMDGIQGAVLNVKLKHLEKWTEARIDRARRYGQLLGDVPQVRLPITASAARHVFHLYVADVEDRDGLLAFLNENGVAAGVHYPTALHNLTAYRSLGHRPEDFPVAHACQGKIISLPICPMLTVAQQEYVAQTVRRFYNC